MIEEVDQMYVRVWREHDLEGALRDVPADFEWVVPGHPDGAVRHGPDEVIDFFRDWIDQWQDPQTDWSLEQTGPNTVLALVTTRARGRASGVPVDLEVGQVWTFRDGRPARMVLYADPERARRGAEADAQPPP